jgi:hypothetical protein
MVSFINSNSNGFYHQKFNFQQTKQYSNNYNGSNTKKKEGNTNSNVVDKKKKKNNTKGGKGGTKKGKNNKLTKDPEEALIDKFKINLETQSVPSSKVTKIEINLSKDWLNNVLTK